MRKHCHIIPEDDLKEHTLSAECDCHPLIKLVDGVPPFETIIHNAWDVRESYERATKLGLPNKKWRVEVSQ